MAALPVEGSWRMVDGEHDSFETSVVPNDNDDPFLSSGQPSQLSAIDTGGSGGNSQEDDIQAFLRKAEEDERVLLRSPFRPSLPSSVRQSPRSNNTGNTYNSVDQTPDPEFHMPSVDVASASGGGKGKRSGLRERQPFGVSRGGSPAQRNRRSGRRGSPAVANSTAPSSPETTPTPESWASSGRSPAGAWKWSPLLSILLGTGVVAVASVLAWSAWSASAASPTALAPVCGVPGMTWLDLAVCRPADETDDADETEKPIGSDLPDRPVRIARPRGGLVDDAREIMYVQTQLAAVVRDRVVAGAASSGAAAQDAWLVPRAQLKDLRLALETQQRREAKEDSSSPSSEPDALLMLEVDGYFEAIKDVTMALSRLQTGAAAASADTLAHVSQRTLAQLRRVLAGEEAGTDGTAEAVETAEADDAEATDADDTRAEDPETEPEPPKGWLARLFGSRAPSAASQAGDRLALVDAYRRHAQVLAAKTGDRAGEAKDVLTALETAGVHLEAMEAMVAARRDDLTGASKEEDGADAPSVPPSWFQKLLAGVARSMADKRSQALQQWEDYAAQLRVVRAQHDVMAARTSEALVELTELRGMLQPVLERLAKGAESGRPRSLEVRMHMAIVEEGMEDLAKI